MKTPKLALALCLAAAALAAPERARAADRESPYKKIKDAVIRQLYPVKGSSVFTLNVGAGFGQEYIRDLHFGLSYRYHFSNYVGIGLNAVYAVPFESGLVGEIRAVRPASLQTIQPEAMMAAFGLDFHFVPVYGKFVAFGKWAVHYVMSFTVGAGAVLAQRKDLDGQTNLPPSSVGVRFAPVVGVHMRMHFSKSVGMFAEFRDYIWQESLATRPSEKAWGNHYSVMIGPAFIF